MPRRTSSAASLAALATFAALACGCQAIIRPVPPKQPPAPVETPAEKARRALDAGDLAAASSELEGALAAPAATSGGPPAAAADAGAPYADAAGPAIVAIDAERARLLALRAELQVRSARYAEASRDAELASTALALRDARALHLRLARLFEDARRDDEAELHLERARDLCAGDDELVAEGACDEEREALVRIRMARGRYAEAEPLVLAEIADVQARYGSYDLRLARAFCRVASFYCRQGKYVLCAPLFARSFDLWKTLRDDAYAEMQRALSAGEANPFDEEFLRPRAGNAPFAAPCGLEEQPAILYKIGKPEAAAEAAAFENRLWKSDGEAAQRAVNYLALLQARGAPPLELAPAHHAVAFIAVKKGDFARAEEELRSALAIYDLTWTAAPVSTRREIVADYLGAMERLVAVLRASGRLAEAAALGTRAAAIAAETVDAYDALHLDTLLSLVVTYREMRDPALAEDAAVRYLDAVVAARGDQQSDYAWALRNLSFVYLMRDDLDASARMEMQAKAIWKKQGVMAAAF